MSDKDKGKDNYPGGMRNWAENLIGGTLDSIMWPLITTMGSVMGFQEKTKRAFQLAPGDIIEVAHLRIYVVAVHLLDNAHPNHSHHQGVQVMGSECTWKHNDWHWRSSEIMDSPFLHFNALQEIEVIRTAPDRVSALEQFNKLEEQLKEEEEKEAEKRRAMRQKARATDEPDEPNEPDEPSEPDDSDDEGESSDE